MTDNADRLRQFMQRVWNAGDAAAVGEFLAPQYTIYSDPGDPWDGQTLTPASFTDRLLTSRAPFPDLHFEIGELIEAGDRIALSWTMRGTQLGPMGERPPTGRAFAVQGMTIYYFADGLLVGHRQVVDRLSVAQQLGLFG